jgi:hypothetical protein
MTIFIQKYKTEDLTVLRGLSHKVSESWTVLLHGVNNVEILLLGFNMDISSMITTVIGKEDCIYILWKNCS